jgi:hypothetical protein
MPENTTPIQIVPPTPPIPHVDYRDVPEFLLLHKEYTLQDVHGWAATPRRANVRREFTEADSFLEYVNKMARPDRTVLLGCCGGAIPRFVAVLDYHDAPERPLPEIKAKGIATDTGKVMEPLSVQLDTILMPTEPLPRWCAHVATFIPQFSRQYLTWLNHSQNNDPPRNFSPVEFGEFLEENAPDVIEPAAAEMMDVAMNLTVSKGVAYRNHERLEDGNLIYHFEETVTGQAVKAGKALSIPRSFRLRLPVFVGSPQVDLGALFRYRGSPQGVSMGYKLQRLDALVEAEVQNLANSIEGQVTTVNRMQMLHLTPGDVSSIAATRS